MRLWSTHPDLLDRAALVAGWLGGLAQVDLIPGPVAAWDRAPRPEGR